MTGCGEGAFKVCNDTWIPVVGSRVDGEATDSTLPKSPHQISAQTLSLGSGGSYSTLPSGEDVYNF